MCGIVGFTGPLSENTVARMNRVQRHRGPDDQGTFADVEDLVTLAMSRLAILDLAGGHQPMANGAEDIWIVYNGEVYNSPKLRSELKARGVRFKTDHSDTEDILALYERSGPDARWLHELNGMFAFVIYDRKRKVLFGARDRLGLKPLYYSLSGGRFSFASELKSLLECEWVSRDLNLQSVFHYMSFQCVPAPESIFKSVSKLPAGHSFVWDIKKKTLQIEKWWAPKFGEGAWSGASERDLPGLVSSELKAATRRWMLSDVPVACSLSGGIDSSALVGVIGDGNLMEGKRLKTYCLGFKNQPDLEETHLARLVADRWNTEHHEIIIDPEDLLSEIDAMVYHLDEPYAGGLPSWFVYRAMAKDVKVGITGSGGDELFGNYGKWIPYENPLRRLKRTARSFLHDRQSPQDLLKYPKGFFYPLYLRDQFKRSRLLSGDFESSEGLVERLWKESGLRDPRDAVPAIDLQIQLPEEYLFVTDRFSMAHSLEVRTPFLDHEFVEKVFSIPASLRTDPSRLKSLLIRSIGHLIPAPLLGERKRYFALPTWDWLRGRMRPRVEHFLSPKYLREQGLFKTDLFETVARPHLEGKTNHLHSRLWTVLNFQFWYEKFVKKGTIAI